jgi:hypothetical protein
MTDIPTLSRESPAMDAEAPQPAPTRFYQTPPFEMTVKDEHFALALARAASQLRFHKIRAFGYRLGIKGQKLDRFAADMAKFLKLSRESQSR